VEKCPRTPWERQNEDLNYLLIVAVILKLHFLWDFKKIFPKKFIRFIFGA